MLSQIDELVEANKNVFNTNVAIAKVSLQHLNKKFVHSTKRHQATMRSKQCAFVQPPFKSKGMGLRTTMDEQLGERRKSPFENQENGMAWVRNDALS